jgi:4-alpha-glucanotransferase
MRRAGILLHITSLPSNGPIGDLGPAAHAWLDWLRGAGCRVWQVLPLNPVGPGGCPYASTSALAAEPALISLEGLVADGLLDGVGPAPGAGDQVDWAAVDAWKRPLLSRAGRRLAQLDPAALAAYADARPWAREWALFAALHARRESDWQSWPEAGLRDRDPAALAEAREALRPEIDEAIALQLLFDRQWAALRAAAAARGVALMGDMPLFVSGDSVDTWADRDLFQLGPDGYPTVVAGAPPDAFSEEGQRWGSPCYDWPVHEARGFAWWRRRIDRLFELTDIVRIDHFRGLQATWTIPAEAETATAGAWKEVPGSAMFKALGPRNLVAEDLGVITPAVEALRAEVGCPGMKILQFAFGEGPHHAYLPHNYEGPDCVAYTGTHDTDTAVGWYRAAGPREQDRYRRYAGADGADVAWDLIRLAWASVASIAIAPMQDVMGLGSEARMNIPGTTGPGNWGWRMRGAPWWAEGRLRELAESYGRLTDPKPRRGGAAGEVEGEE